MNKLYNIDCMEYMKDIPDKYFDLCITDPPYGIDIANKLGGSLYFAETNKKDWDKYTPDKNYFKELFRVSQNQIIFGGHYFVEYLYASMGWIVWDKNNGSSTFSDGELIYTSFQRALRIFKKTWCGSSSRSREEKVKIHPTQKPIALYKWLLTNYSKPGFKLLDTHSGSGSFRIAAYDLGFDLDSCELDTDYCQSNEARYQNHIKQGDLFKPEEIQKQIYQKELIK